MNSTKVFDAALMGAIIKKGLIVKMGGSYHLMSLKNNMNWCGKCGLVNSRCEKTGMMAFCMAMTAYVTRCVEGYNDIVFVKVTPSERNLKEYVIIDMDE